MGNIVFTYAKGRFIEKALLPLAPADNLIVVLLKTGLQVDGTIKHHATLASLLASSGNVEANFTNYARKVLTADDITVSFNTTTSVASMAIDSLVWNAAGGALDNDLGGFLVCYRPSSLSTDAQILPLTKHDYAGSTNGQNLEATVTSIASDT